MNIKKFNIMTFSITKFSLMTLRIMCLFATMSINDIEHNDTQ